MNARRLLNIITIVIITATLFLLRDEVKQAWHLLSQVNPLILLLILPLQFGSYYATGSMMFSYLKKQGALKKMKQRDVARLALELNFVNHVLPSGGVSGASYITWRLGHFGVSAGRAALAQAVRFGATFISFVILLILAVIFVTFDSGVNRLIILVSSALAGGIVSLTLFTAFLLNSGSRLQIFSGYMHTFLDFIAFKILRRKKSLVKARTIDGFFRELADDYQSLKKDPRSLLPPLGWGLIFNVFEVAAYIVVFWSLGTALNPAPIFIALGIATIVGFFFVTPGGAGGYEATMILFLGISGISGGTVLAGVLLTRIIMILLTISTGYVFYHLALRQHGKHSS